MTLETISTSDLDTVTGGLSEGQFLTEALRRGMSAPHSSAPVARRNLKKSSTNPGWCDDGFGIVPCR